MVPQSYFIDFDTQRYAIQVKLDQQGDGSFSYMHNLLKTWIFYTYLGLKAINGLYDTLDAAKTLTLFFGFIATFFIALSTYHLTRNRHLSALAGLLWFAIPGNIQLMHTLEDNVWAAGINALSLYLALRASGIQLDDGHPSIHPIWSPLAGAVIGIGINLHQQLAVEFYLFILLIVLSPALRPRRKLISIMAFCSVYLLISILQNKIAFNSYELINSMRRLYHNPYIGVFPSLWFFSSNLSLSSWMDLILQGWSTTFLLHSYRPLAIYLLLIPISVVVPMVTAAQHLRKPCNETRHQLIVWALITLTILIHVPHSLLFEPQNIERWDSTIPGLILLGFISISILYTNHAKVDGVQNGQDITAFITLLLILPLILVSFYQSATYVNQLRYHYSSHPGVKALNTVLAQLQDKDHSQNHIVVLEEAMSNWDLQSLVTYHYPELTVLTVEEKELVPIYSSRDQLQHLADYPRKPIYTIPFGPSAQFSIMDRIARLIEHRSTSFLLQYPVTIIR